MASYRIKGTGYVGHLKWVEEKYPGGQAAFFEHCDPTLRAYFQQTFLENQSYDLYPLVNAAPVCARALKMTAHQFVVMRSVYQANYDQAGVYRLLFKIVSPNMLAPRIPKTMAQYFNFGKTDVLEHGAGFAKFAFGPLPDDLVDWFDALFAGFIPAVLEQSSAKGASARLIERTPCGWDQDGAKMAQMTVEVRWS